MTQEQALRIMKTGVNVYLTGSAGSGKTYLLNKYIKYLESHGVPVAVTASTGIAATHMNGMTIHSWSGLGIKDHLDERELEKLEERKYLWKRFDKARVLIIDEISMLEGKQLEMVERICRRFKRNDKPFGGLQVILSGDFFQLPPVRKGEDKDGEIIPKSKVWQILNPAVCYLEEQFRQKDDILTGILNKIRSNQIEEGDYQILEKRIGVNISAFKPTKLYTHNADVDLINEKELAEINEQEITFVMTGDGPLNLVEILKKSSIATEVLKMKKGAEIMCIKNNFEMGYVNGSRGKIVDFELDTRYPVVELYSGQRVTLKPESWSIEEEGRIKASIKQIPLRLAWAITIHKSQGMSLDNAEIDLGKTFTYGMGYVALSRVRTLEGIILKSLDKKALLVDPRVLEVDRELKNQSAQNKILFTKLSSQEQQKLENDFILKMGGEIEISKNRKTNRGVRDTKISTLEETKKLLESGLKIKEIAKERNLTTETILSHIEKIVASNPKIKKSQIKPQSEIIKLVKRAQSKIKNKEDKGKLKPIKELLEKEGHDISYLDIRLARLFI
ncbi:MAG TPA: AAA family ATPase [Candidatus Paceibacterota bacterium]|jgi:ATP-dependent exoDNAse (exonuclease V) alpha subunit|nr:AAA family ATPase [Candidatus Paceibacterota bacterium]HPC12556.1 AAA family ATPase [Candidatus Paceibacterota bacterium]HQC46247.1 AAA family ATPase [Candidatus Paceibacterota bacterium]